MGLPEFLQCRELVLMHRVGTIRVRGQGRAVVDSIDAQPARRWLPRSVPRPVPASVPIFIADDYLISGRGHADQPKGKRCTSRRCLQNTIPETKGSKKGSLEQEIDEVIAKGMVSSALGEQLDAVRQIGNFAAHPLSTSTGDIVAIEPGEAERNLDVLDGLFEDGFCDLQTSLPGRPCRSEPTDAGKPPPTPALFVTPPGGDSSRAPKRSAIALSLSGRACWYRRATAGVGSPSRLISSRTAAPAVAARSHRCRVGRGNDIWLRTTGVTPCWRTRGSSGFD